MAHGRARRALLPTTSPRHRPGRAVTPPAHKIAPAAFLLALSALPAAAEPMPWNQLWPAPPAGLGEKPPSGIDKLLPGMRIDPKTGYVDPKTVLVRPPAKYDHPYKGDLTITYTSMKHVKEMCPPVQAGFPPIGCSYYDGYRPDYPTNTYCKIILAHDEEIRAVGWEPNTIYRHEQAHCNGWPANHPGAR